MIRHVAWIFCSTVLCVLAGCGSVPQPPSAPLAEDSETYRSGMAESAALTAQYVQHWERNRAWPAPGTYNTKTLIYKATEATSPEVPNRRRDFYRTLFNGGRELDLCLYPDGKLEIKIFQH